MDAVRGRNICNVASSSEEVQGFELWLLSTHAYLWKKLYCMVFFPLLAPCICIVHKLSRRHGATRAKQVAARQWENKSVCKHLLRDRDTGGQTHRTLQGGRELAPKVAPRRLGVLNPKFAKFRGPWKLNIYPPPLIFGDLTPPPHPALQTITEITQGCHRWYHHKTPERQNNQSDPKVLEYQSKATTERVPQESKTIPPK